MKKVGQRKSRIMFGADTEDKSDDPISDEQQTKLLLRTRRQSRGAIDGNIVLNVPGADQADKMKQISQKIAQKVKVDNLVRNLKTSEMEKFSLNKRIVYFVCIIVYLFMFRAFGLSSKSG